MAAIDSAALPAPTSPDFFPALLAGIRTVAPSFPVHPVVLQSILLCLIAAGDGDVKNLILRTREEDVSLVSKLAASVSKSFGMM